MPNSAKTKPSTAKRYPSFREGLRLGGPIDDGVRVPYKSPYKFIPLKGQAPRPVDSTSRKKRKAPPG